MLSIYAYEKINGRKEITVSNLFETPATDEKIPVNPLYSMAENSQFYFKKYAKMKTRLTIGKEKAEECLMKIKYLNNLSYFCDTVSSKEELNTLKEELKSSGIDKILTKKITGKKENSPSLSSLEIDGFKIFIGKNNIQNEFLTLHKAKKNDLWFHAKAIPGSHVVIETENQIVSEKTIEKIASLAAFHSKGKDSGKVDVDYTPIKYVKKIPGGPPGMVSYTHQHTVVVVPQEYKN